MSGRRLWVVLLVSVFLFLVVGALLVDTCAKGWH
jgi:hypothetical protein